VKRRDRGVLRERTRHGKYVWYYRDGQGPRIRLPDEYGSPAFNAAVAAARGGVAPAKKTSLAYSDPSSFAWLVDQFLSSSTFLQKEETTRKARKNVLKRIVEKGAGPMPFREITEDDIRTIRDTIATDHGKVPMQDVAKHGKAAMANGAVAILRVMFHWAVEEAHHLKRNPCLGIKAISYESGTNYVWTNDDMQAFEAAYPLGTRERLAYALLLYSGQRSSDVVLMGRQHIRDGWLVTSKQCKTGQSAGVPVLPVLAEAIAAGPAGNLTFLVGEDGAPLSVSHFGRWFRAACDRAGVPECTPHGLRHAGATRLAARGASNAALRQIFGFTNAMAERYTQTANMRGEAEKAIHLLNHVA
jgi:integrase